MIKIGVVRVPDHTDFLGRRGGVPDIELFTIKNRGHPPYVPRNRSGPAPV